MKLKNGFLFLIFVVSILLLSGNRLFAQSIVVNKPAAGDIFRKNIASTVIWTKTGAMAPTVKIRLFDASGNTIVLPVVDSTPNSGSYTIPAGFFNSIPEGSYTIRVRTVDNQTYGQSAVFQIKNALPQLQTKPKAITITNPVSGTAWLKAASNTVTWTKTGIMDNRVKIRLLYATSNEKVKNVVENASNSGTYKIAAGFFNDVPKGEYRIRVRTMDNYVLGDSSVFRLVDGFSNLPTMNFIRVKEPVAGSTHYVGHPIKVTWDKNFGNYNYVNLSFVHIDGVKIVGHSVPNSGTYSWTPQSVYNNMEVYVDIQTEDGKFSGKSGNFNLSEPETLQ